MPSKNAPTYEKIAIAEQHFRWDAFLAANANLGLFGERKLVDLRIASGKPGAGWRQTLRATTRIGRFSFSGWRGRPRLPSSGKNFRAN